MKNDQNALQKLQQWSYRHHKQEGVKFGLIAIDTLSNPGWGFTINFPKPLAGQERTCLFEYSEPEEDDSTFDYYACPYAWQRWCLTFDSSIWFQSSIGSDEFLAAGGVFNLQDALLLCVQWMYPEEAAPIPSNTIARLESWYRSQCNREWERTNGVTIATEADSSWRLTVDLDEIDFNNQDFTHLWRGENEKEEFIECKVEQQKFLGFCGPFCLEDMLTVFLDWIERSQIVPDRTWLIHLMDWSYKVHRENVLPKGLLTIESQNFGWSLTANMGLFPISHRPPYEYSRNLNTDYAYNSEVVSDWIHCRYTGSQYLGTGGFSTLDELIDFFVFWAHVFHKYEISPLVMELQNWYLECCNKGQKKLPGIVISTEADGSWKMLVEFNGSQPYSQNNSHFWKGENDKEDFIDCSIQDQLFHGVCGPFCLTGMLNLFLNWIKGTGCSGDSII